MIKEVNTDHPLVLLHVQSNTQAKPENLKAATNNKSQQRGRGSSPSSGHVDDLFFFFFGRERAPFLTSTVCFKKFY